MPFGQDLHDWLLIWILGYPGGRGHWSLAAVGSERVFNDFNGEGHRTGTYVEGRRGLSCEWTTEIAGHCGRGSISVCLAVG